MFETRGESNGLGIPASCAGQSRDPSSCAVMVAVYGTSHSQHGLAKRQTHVFGRIVSIDVRGGGDEARKFMEGCRLFALAEPLGGVESLVTHPAIMVRLPVPSERRAALGIADSLVRLTVGVENIVLLRAELDADLGG